MDINPVISMKTNKKSNKRRFSEEQVRSMESMFNSESRPGLKTKQQIADQLGLDPHQVAIWFQNRRARTKSKQTERDYSILKARYDSLSSKYDALIRENQSLITEVQRLKGSKERPKDNTSDTNQATCSSNGESIVWPEEYFQDNIFSDAKSEEFNNCERNLDNHENSSLDPTYLHYASDWWEFWP